MKINETSLIDILPRFMTEDITVQCMAAAVDYIIARVLEKLPLVNLLDNLQLVSEDNLDYIAKKEKIYWYDMGYSADVKRKIIANFEKNSRILGTQAAVVNMANEIFPFSELQEWFEYDGEEKHFRLNVRTNQNVDIMETMFVKKIDYVKNLRSVMDEIRINKEIEAENIRAGVKMTEYKINRIEQI